MYLMSRRIVILAACAAGAIAWSASANAAPQSFKVDLTGGQQVPPVETSGKGTADLTYDPATALRKVTCPVLALNGSLDTQVPPKLNLPAIRKALEEGGNKHFEVDELSGLNHLFQTAKTGAPAEYGEIEETISPVALEKISSWILKQ